MKTEKNINKLVDITSLKFLTNKIIIKHPNKNKIIGILLPAKTAAIRLSAIIKINNGFFKFSFL